MKVKAKETIGSFIVKGNEYTTESTRGENYIIDGIGWNKKRFDIVQCESFELDVTAYNESKNKQLQNIIEFVIYELDPCQTPFDIDDRSTKLLQKYIENEKSE